MGQTCESRTVPTSEAVPWSPRLGSDRLQLWVSPFSLSPLCRLRRPASSTDLRVLIGSSSLNAALLESLSALNSSANRQMFDDWSSRGNQSGCIRCAVVGNGGILRGSKKGAEIDSHHYVFRWGLHSAQLHQLVLKIYNIHMYTVCMYIQYIYICIYSILYILRTNWFLKYHITAYNSSATCWWLWCQQLHIYSHEG